MDLRTQASSCSSRTCPDGFRMHWGVEGDALVGEGLGRDSFGMRPSIPSPHPPPVDNSFSGWYIHSPTIIWDWFYFDKDSSDIYEAMHAIHVTNLHLYSGNTATPHAEHDGKYGARLRPWNWWDKCTGIIVYLVHRYSGGMHDSKVVWKRLKMKPGLVVYFLFLTRDSLRKWENEYKKKVVWLWEWWLTSLVLRGRRFVKS